jgi:general stress protein YciG
MAGTSNRGFASMDAEKQRMIASKGGKAAHEAGTAHEFTPEEARRAGSKGGEIVSENRAHMAAIGSKGGQSHGQSSAARSNSSGASAATSIKRGAKDEEDSASRSADKESHEK